MTRQMFVISHGEACDWDRNQIREHIRDYTVNGDSGEKGYRFHPNR